jgi:hypothetical protein
MKHYRILFLVLLITSCSNEWKEYGYSASEIERAKYLGFENPVDYKEAIDLGISSYHDFSAYRFGEYENLSQFKYAKYFRLQTLSEVKNHITSISCVDTPSYGQVCSIFPFIELFRSQVYDLARPLLAQFDLNLTSFDEFGPRLEYYLTRANEHIDYSDIEVALDCSSNHEYNYRTVFILSHKTLISPFHFDILRRDPIKALISYRSNKFAPRRHAEDYNFLVDREYEDLTNAIVIRSFSRPMDYLHSGREFPGGPGYTQIVSAKSWEITDDFHYLHFDGSYNTSSSIQIDRKTGFGKKGDGIDRPLYLTNYSYSYQCKPFNGDVKKYLKNDVFKHPITHVVKNDIKKVNRIKAEELAKKKKEEERAKMENKF